MPIQGTNLTSSHHLNNCCRTFSFLFCFVVVVVNWMYFCRHLHCGVRSAVHSYSAHVHFFMIKGILSYSFFLSCKLLKVFLGREVLAGLRKRNFLLTHPIHNARV